MKLAEASVAGEVLGEHPVMLLDDVLSELDDARQTYLLTRIEDKQTFVTTCDSAAFARTNGKLVFDAMKLADKGHGVLLLTLNYAGDQLAGKQAMKLARKAGLNVRQVVTGEEIQYDPSGEDNKRGLAGAVALYHIAAAPPGRARAWMRWPRLPSAMPTTWPLSPSSPPTPPTPRTACLSATWVRPT